MCIAYHCNHVLPLQMAENDVKGMKDGGRKRGKPVTTQRLLTIAVGVAILAIVVANLPLTSVTGPPAPKKPYRTFETFYPFYLTEHTEITNRRLHIVGTSVVFALLAYNPITALSVATTGCVGYVLCALCAGLSNGIVEFAAMLVTLFAAHYYYTGGQFKYVVLIPLVGYSFAWVGHFYFEKNKPASFIYPVFSLMGDFRMWYDVVTGAQYGIWK